MSPYKKIFQDFYECYYDEKMMCVGCGMAVAVDIHHLSIKGLGGGKNKDYIENLAPVCRECHSKCHGSKQFNKEVRIKTLKLVVRKLEE